VKKAIDATYGINQAGAVGYIHGLPNIQKLKEELKKHPKTQQSKKKKIKDNKKSAHHLQGRLLSFFKTILAGARNLTRRTSSFGIMRDRLTVI
jgi:hypothetical protein